ncbi:MAG TPA: AGE family epimerase/isomerase [Phenylobacterium sp.]|uniref:AGE family epimerase/isomerase n=1 Tax=Phenylobacterium sp. TaxID=1871053 RepID=UPI002D47B2B3|nr:AGE family epimerase/isomerase [Phenylobacterium sp.]HZZ66575.1 AGE family epimerase/isomerase [Phenylobacterium sp.]
MPSDLSSPLTSLAEAKAWYDPWLRDALKVWATKGADPANGGFREGLSVDGAVFDPHRRMRSQTRQVLVFAKAAAIDTTGPWAQVARQGFAFLSRRGRRPDGLFANSLTLEGEVLDPTPRLYEQAFALLALAALHEAGVDDEAAANEAAALGAKLAVFRHAAGGFAETGEHPYQANAHMHLLEATLAWESLARDGPWAALADEIVELALARFIDGGSGALNEFFDATWTPLTGEAGLLEPGHHFEWAWLLERWGARRGHAPARAAAARLFDLGLKGVDADRQVAINSVWADFRPRDASARLWPQTEFLKAALRLGAADQALIAANGLRAYLETPLRGVWRDKLDTDGRFLAEPAPASSFYHLLLAIQELARDPAAARSA